MQSIVFIVLRVLVRRVPVQTSRSSRGFRRFIVQVIYKFDRLGAFTGDSDSTVGGVSKWKAVWGEVR